MIVAIQWMLIIAAIVLGIMAFVRTTDTSVTQEIKTVQQEMKTVQQEMKTVQQGLQQEMNTLTKGRIVEMGQTVVVGKNVNTGSGDRNDVVEVAFTKTYKEPPQILLSVAQIDATTPPNLRYVVDVVGVTTTGFKMQVKTWGNAQLWTTIVKWATVI